ncbi:MAG TPA: UvrD-helicase domain-containing protein [Vicinamibacterales bacterium]|nr:UvrD-helicase domain-containing protein [Vicinamibacterales bacterium]
MRKISLVTDGQARLDFDAGDPLEARDAEARALATDPTRNVALEASAGTGKTRVLVDRYVGLLAAGVKPRNILAITFTRKAAAEMRQRILQELAKRHREQTLAPELWREIRDSITDISISTIDAFCLALLREFPLEADVDPGFDLADETETPRLVGEALERTLRIGRGIATHETEMALLFAELGEYRLREGLARLIDRRLVAWNALNRFLRNAQHATVDDAVTRMSALLRDAFASVPGGTTGLVASGPSHPSFGLLARDIRQLLGEPAPSGALMQALLERVRDHFLTQGGEPRKRLNVYKKADFRSPADYQKHLAGVVALGPYLAAALHAYRQDINTVLARAVRQLYAIALDQYRKTLSKHGVLDFSDVLERTLALLGQMDEFSRSRFKLEARYQHVLVDEFQDTSRAQWELVELLVRSWAAGLGLGARELEPSIFIVGDRKQSIYAFRDAEVAVLDQASRYIEALRPAGQVRTAITRSFRSVRELLSFVNDLFAAIEKAPDRADAFRYSENDRFPLSSVDATDSSALSMIAAQSDEQQAETVADEIAQLLATGATVRDRDTGVRREARAGDIAILFRTRDGHRLYEDALARRRVPYYVYKGLGFFDADEIKDVLALLSFLARPQSELNAAAFLRSRFVRVSDEALKRLAPALSAALLSADPPAAVVELHAADQRRLNLARRALVSWLALVDRLPPSELLDRVISESAYPAEIGGPAYRQARENLKKIRGLVRRMQNRGYATLSRIVDHFAQLVAGGDESNAIIDAIDAVNLMTTHAAKGLEFPIVFIVNMHRGSGGSPDAIRVVASPFGHDETIEPSVAIGEHVSAADRDNDAREAEESKRLLYVAVTRPRDRLYLAATLTEDGRFAPGKGGLGKTLPPALWPLFTTSEGPVSWRGESGEHRFRRLTLATELTQLQEVTAGSDRRVDDFTPMPVSGPERVAATARHAPTRGGEHGRASEPSSIEAGVVVHRALEAGVLDRLNETDLRASLQALIRDDERALIDDVDALVTRAGQALIKLSTRPEVREAFGPDASIEWRRHEMPFSMREEDGTILRGSIDCVVKRRDGVIEILEFKTGRPSLTHHMQLETYLAAARALFPNTPIEGRLIYAE